MYGLDGLGVLFEEDFGNSIRGEAFREKVRYVWSGLIGLVVQRFRWFCGSVRLTFW